MSFPVNGQAPRDLPIRVNQILHFRILYGTYFQELKVTLSQALTRCGPHHLRRNSNEQFLLGAVESVQPDTSEFDDMLIDTGVVGCPVFYSRG